MCWELHLRNYLICAFTFVLNCRFIDGGTARLTALSTPQNLTSQNYPLNYKANIDDQWTISASSSISNPIIAIQVLDSQLEASLACYSDVINIYDGSSTWATVISSWCGSSKPAGIIYSTYGTVIIEFSTDSANNNYRGFKMIYWAKPDSTKIFKDPDFNVMNYALLAIGCAIILSVVSTMIFIIISRNTNTCKIRHVYSED